LQDRNVLIISNHQTYFADVSFFLHVIYSSLAGKPNSISYPGFLNPKKHNIYYVAAEETMTKGFLPKLLALSGAITVQRSWRSDGENVRRKVSKEANRNIDKALTDGWVITFPQGTTTPFAQGRKGTAIIAKANQAVVVPVVIDGFRRAFNKNGIRTKRTGTTLKMKVKAPIEIDYSNTIEEIIAEMMDAIEQTSDLDYMGNFQKEKSDSKE
jgi:1-acyl-sn-glycerol-3-phosphate acyltransferase